MSSRTSEEREVFWGVVLSASVLVFVHYYLDHPVEAVLDAPMAARQGIELGRRERPGGDVVAGGAGGGAVDLALADDPPDASDEGSYSSGEVRLAPDFVCFTPRCGPARRCRRSFRWMGSPPRPPHLVGAAGAGAGGTVTAILSSPRYDAFISCHHQLSGTALAMETS